MKQKNHTHMSFMQTCRRDEEGNIDDRGQTIEIHLYMREQQKSTQKKIFNSAG